MISCEHVQSRLEYTRTCTSLRISRRCSLRRPQYSITYGRSPYPQFALLLPQRRRLLVIARGEYHLRTRNPVACRTRTETTTVPYLGELHSGSRIHYHPPSRGALTEMQRVPLALLDVSVSIGFISPSALAFQCFHFSGGRLRGSCRFSTTLRKCSALLLGYTPSHMAG